MPVRIFLLSLCLSAAVPATMIEPLPLDPWTSLRTAPPPEVVPDPTDYPVPNLALELGQLLQFVMTYAYAGVDNPDEQNAILTALQPQYEAFLNSRQFAAPELPATTLAVEPLSTTDSLTNLSTVPEPRTWLLLAAGLAVLAVRPLRRSHTSGSTPS
jgi:PEP-CTERM motif